MSTINDRDAVLRQYATDDALRTRQDVHDTYTVPKINYFDWVLNSVVWDGLNSVLDVGSGSGKYFELVKARRPGIHYVGMDVSAGMLANHSAPHLAQADALHIPFPKDSFDLVMANHMIYLIDDIDAAITEFRRVLKPEGVLMIATNSTQTMPQIQVLMRRAILLLARSGSSQIQPPVPASDRFALENGTRRLARHFYAVMRHDLPSKLIFPEIDPIIAYLESTRTLREPQLPEGVAWDDVMMIMRQQVTHLIDHLGELIVDKLTGVLVASDSGDFIQRFVAIKTTQGQPG